MTMEMASDYWRVVLDVMCTSQFLGLIEHPHNSFSSSSSFLVDFEVIIRRVASDEADRLLEDDDITPRMIVNKASLDIDLHHDSNPSQQMSATLFEALRQLQVPIEERASVVENIMFKASETVKITGATTKRMHLLVEIDFYAIEDDGDDEDEANNDGDYYYEPRFVSATISSIEKLERMRVDVALEVCSVCMDEMMVGSEATKIPCGHFYHEACIVGWLQQSGVCPLCKFRMPINNVDANKSS